MTWFWMKEDNFLIF
nr:unnamed protein product [Callosobruchus chinensis]